MQVSSLIYRSAALLWLDAVSDGWELQFMSIASSMPSWAPICCCFLSIYVKAFYLPLCWLLTTLVFHWFFCTISPLHRSYACTKSLIQHITQNDQISGQTLNDIHHLIIDVTAELSSWDKEYRISFLSSIIHWQWATPWEEENNFLASLGKVDLVDQRLFFWEGYHKELLEVNINSSRSEYTRQ
jgi:hypothetical protein